MNQPPWDRLAGVTVLDVHTRCGRRTVCLFDPHRLALPCWAGFVGDGPPALLLTLDRHHDLMTPEFPQQVPHRSQGLQALDEHARWKLRSDNQDHVLAAMEAGVLGHCISVARTWTGGGSAPTNHADSRGGAHVIRHARAPVEVLGEMRRTDATSAAHFLEQAVAARMPIILDLDLDAFTSLSDADPTEVVPWSAALIRSYLLPDGALSMWEEVLRLCMGVTLAREPVHCGGVLAAAALFERVAQVLFVELLGAELP